MNAKRLNLLTISGWQALLFYIGWLTTSAFAAPNLLTHVSVTEGQNQSQVIKFVLKEPLESSPVSFTTSNPHRLVLDFPNISSSLGRVQETVNTSGIKNYQVVQAGDRTRVVFNLTGPASHELRKDKNVVLAILQVAPGKQAAATAQEIAPTRFAETGNVREHGIKDVEFRRGKNIALSDPGVGIDIQQKGRSIQVDFLNTSLPGPLQRRMDVTDFATPAQMVEIFEQGKNTRMLVTPTGKWDYSAYQTGNQFIMEVRPVEEASPGKPELPVYTGEKLTLNFQNVEVRSVLQVIADFTGLNIVASDTVAGNITLRLKDVPWDQALDIILRAKGLDKRIAGKVIWVAPRDELAAKEKQELEARKAKVELEPLHTQIYKLNYVRADTALAIISGDNSSVLDDAEEASCTPSATSIRQQQRLNTNRQGQMGGTGIGMQASKVNRVLSERGGASHDLTTNSLIVNDTLDRHAQVEKVLKEIDIPTRQVMIEARIVVADEGFSRDLGARLGFQGSGKSGNTTIGAGTYESSAGGATTGVSATAPPPNINLPAETISTATGLSPGRLGFTIFNASAAAILSLELQALEADNKGKIVSNPRVVTTNLRPATILQGKQIPYLNTTSTTQGASTSFKDALLCLLVSPQVLNNDEIILNVEVTKDALGETTDAGPAINVKRVKTQVRVNNGETAVLGGIFEQESRNDSTKVPFLGDLPILGHLFKTTNKSDAKTEMLIFLTPRILSDAMAVMR